MNSTGKREKRGRMSSDLMELNDAQLNYIYFGDEANSDDASNDSDEDLILRSILFFFEQFSIVQTSEDFSIRGIVYRKTYSIFPIVIFFSFLAVTFVENAIIAGTAF